MPNSLNRLSQFSAAHFADRLPSGGTRLAYLAKFAGRRGYQPRGYPAGRVHGNGPADGKRLVVGMRKKNKKTVVGHD